MQWTAKHHVFAAVMIVAATFGLSLHAVVGGPTPALAQVPNTNCVNLLNGDEQCTLRTTVAENNNPANPATMTIAVNSPSGVTITADTAAPDGLFGTCSTTSGAGTPTVTLTCGASGLSAGSVVYVVFSSQQPSIVATVTYNANQSTQSNVNSNTDNGNCTITQSNTGNTWTCSNTTTQAVNAGNQIAAEVDEVPGTCPTTCGATYGVSYVQPTVGTCPLVSESQTPPTPATSTSSDTSFTAVWICGAGQSVPAGTTFSITGSWQSSCLPGLGCPPPPKPSFIEVTTENANCSSSGSGTGSCATTQGPATQVINFQNLSPVPTCLGPSIPSIPVGNLPLGAAVNPNTNTIYVSNTSDGTVSVISGATNTVSATLSVGQQPEGVAVNPNTNTIYVADFGANNSGEGLYGSLSVINGTNNSATSINLPGNPRGVAVDPGNNTVYVANGNGDVSVIDGATNQVTNTVHVATTVNGNVVSNENVGFGIVVHPITHMVFVADPLDNNVAIIQGSRVTGRIPASFSPNYLALNSATDTLYVGGVNSSSIAAISGASSGGSGTSTITLNSSTDVADLAFNSSSNTVYVDELGYGANLNPNFEVIDGSTNQVTSFGVAGSGQISGSGRSLQGIAVDESTGAVYVADAGDNAVLEVCSGGGSGSAAPHQTTTSVSCGAVSTFLGAETTSCTATVTDTSGSGASAPKGDVSFSSNGGGSFGINPCILTPSGGSSATSSCSVVYSEQPQTLTNPSPSVPIAATYQPTDNVHGASSGSTTITIAPFTFVVTPQELAGGSTSCHFASSTVAAGCVVDFSADQGAGNYIVTVPQTSPAETLACDTPPSTAFGCSVSNNTLTLTAFSPGDQLGYHIVEGQASQSSGRAGRVSGLLARLGGDVVAVAPADQAGSLGTTTITGPTGPLVTNLPLLPGLSVSVAAGWNLMGGPTGSQLGGSAGALYTFQASDSAYESFPTSTALSGGIGVWAYFPQAGLVTGLPSVTAQTQQIALPASHYVMAGNPTDGPVTLTATTATTWAITFNSATNSYGSWTRLDAGGSLTLQAGQGAWVFATNGGTLTITSE